MPKAKVEEKEVPVEEPLEQPEEPLDQIEEPPEAVPETPQTEIVVKPKAPRASFAGKAKAKAAESSPRVAGKKDGLEVWWHENGKKAYEVNYKDGEEVEGSKKFWNSKGEPVKLESVNEDELERLEGIMDLKGSDTPYTGKAVSYTHLTLPTKA